MAMPKKGSRKIIVNGENYRWRVRQNTNYWNLLSGDGLAFAVEHEKGNNVLHINLQGFGHFQSWATNLRTLVITPSIVAQAIEVALQKGWKSEQKGSAFEVTLTQDEHNI